MIARSLIFANRNRYFIDAIHRSPSVHQRFKYRIQFIVFHFRARQALIFHNDTGLEGRSQFLLEQLLNRRKTRKTDIEGYYSVIVNLEQSSTLITHVFTVHIVIVLVPVENIGAGSI